MDQVAKMIRPRGILCDAADVNKTVDFWRSLPGFRKQAVNNTGAVLVCGDFMVRLRKTDGPPAPVDVPGIRGIEHLALAVQNAAAAIKEERYARFELNTDRGSPYENPGVWTYGTLYFDFIWNGGTKVEVCQPLDAEHERDLPYEGISHIGICTGDFDQTVKFYQGFGFEADETLENETEADGRFVCTMMRKDGCWLEIYQLKDVKEQVTGAGAIRGILFACDDADAVRRALRDAGATGLADEPELGDEGFSIPAPDGTRLFFSKNKS